MAPNQRLETILYVSWEEVEEGWGNRPIGVSLHLNRSQWEQYNAEFRRDEKNTPTFDTYDRPANSPLPAFVDSDTFERIKQSANGIFVGTEEMHRLVDSKSFVYGDVR